MGSGGDLATPSHGAVGDDGRRMRLRLPGTPWDSSLGRDLPRGRHGFPLDEVGAYQRVRLLDAFVAEVGRVGYSDARVSTVCAEAGTSRPRCASSWLPTPSPSSCWPPSRSRADDTPRQGSRPCQTTPGC